MSCNHCANRVKEALEKEQNIKKVTVNLTTNTVEIISKKTLEIEKIKNIIETLGYKFISLKK